MCSQVLQNGIKLYLIVVVIKCLFNWNYFTLFYNFIRNIYTNLFGCIKIFVTKIWQFKQLFWLKLFLSPSLNQHP